MEYSESFSIFQTSILHNVQTPVAMLLLQVIAILFVAKIFGWVFKKMGQPSVIGEIVAGIVLGPSVLTKILPQVSSFLFAPESLGNINILSQIGLILFMFAIGLELDLSEVKKKLKATIFISNASIIFPFFCGVLTAYWTYSEYVPKTTPFVSYALFIGIALSITAFPVLARIIQEKGLTKSHLGTMSLASAANGDIIAWCLLAIVIAIAQSGAFAGAIYTILFAALFLLFMFFVLKPFLNIIGNVYHNKEVVNKSIVAFMLLVLIISSYLTEILGVHALFGAFIAGVVMPSNIKFRKIMAEKVEDVSLSLFLPLFFVSTGLRTELGLINSPSQWLVCLMFIGVAIFGKVFGTAFASRLVGESWKDSWSMGALMNTRGLMELIILTIGYEMKILPPSIFVMLVLMTLVTTFMTGPLLNFINYYFSKKEKKIEGEKTLENFRLLLSFGRASSGSVLLNVASQIFSKAQHPLELTALHLTVGTEINPILVDNFEETSFTPILEEANLLNINLKTRYDVTNDAGQEIVNIMNQENYHFLLVGAGISMSTLPEDVAASRHREAYFEKYFSRLNAPEAWFYPGDLLKDKTRMFIEQTKAPVGIFVNRDFEMASEVLVILKNKEDIFLLEYAKNLILSNRVLVTVLDHSNVVIRDESMNQQVRSFMNENSTVKLLSMPQLSKKMLIQHNFMLIGYYTWLEVSESEKETLQLMPSTLIVSK